MTNFAETVEWTLRPGAEKLLLVAPDEALQSPAGTVVVDKTVPSAAVTEPAALAGTPPHPVSPASAANAEAAAVHRPAQSTPAQASQSAPAPTCNTRYQPVLSDDQPPVRNDWHLRKKRADLYVDMQSACPFLKPMLDFLKDKGLSILPYDPHVHYLAYEVILCDGARAPQEGRIGILDQGKGAVWAVLKQNFSSRLS